MSANAKEEPKINNKCQFPVEVAIAVAVEVAVEVAVADTPEYNRIPLSRIPLRTHLVYK